MTANPLHPSGAAMLGPSARAPDGTPGGRGLLAERIAEALRGAGEVWLVTGERGSGRTTLLADAVARVPGAPARIVRVDVEPDGERLTLRGFVARVAVRSGPGPDAPETDAPDGDTPDGDALERAFDLLAGDEPTVLVVDGADGLAVEVLRYIQFASKSAPGLQVVLVALPGFRAVLERDEFAHLRSRLGPELVVPPLSDEDALRLLRGRLGAVRGLPVQAAEEAALGALIRAGRGSPGRLTGLLDRALAHGAQRGEVLLTPAAVSRAVSELDRPHAPSAVPAPVAAIPAAAAPAPAEAAPGTRPEQAPERRAKLAPPRPAPRRSVLVPVAAALAVAGLGVGAWVVLAARHGAQAPPAPPAPSAAASAPVPDRAVRPAPAPATRAERAPPAAAVAPVPDAPVQDAARPAPPQTPPPPPASAQSQVPPDLLAALLSRGEAMLAVGDVSAARLLFERAASGGDPLALRAAGRAYDPAVLARLGAVGIRPDPARAAEYYGRAAALGDIEARRLLRQLGAGDAAR